MKITALLMALLLCFLAVIPASATEITLPEARYLCDADKDGAVTAADARFILRKAVGIDYTEGVGWMDWTDIVYCDSDENGDIDAADARFALRTAVGLEELRKHAFTITFSEEPKCIYGLTVTAECAITGKVIVIEKEPYPHDLNSWELCAGTGECYTCKQTVFVAPEHNFKLNLCEGIKRCQLCNYEEYFDGGHVYGRGSSCRRCSNDLRYSFSSFVCDFLSENGTEVNEPDGAWFTYYQETDGYFLFTFINDYRALIDASCEMAVEVEGQVYNFFAYFDLSRLTMEVECYLNEKCVAFCKTEVYSDLIGTSDTGKGIGMKHYESSIPELQSQREAFRVISDGMATALFSWFKEFAIVNGFEDADDLFSENPLFK